MTNKKKNSKQLKAPEKLKALFVIVDRNKTDFYVDILQGFQSNLQTILYAKGTVPSDIALYLGLEDTKKSVIMSIIQEKEEKEIISTLNDKFTTVKKGKGIAFTISMTSVIGVLIYQYLSNQKGEL